METATVTTTNDHYRSRLEDMRAERDDVSDDTYGPDALSIEVERVFCIILGTGGPHDEVRIYVNQHGEVTRGEYGYYWAGMEGHGDRDLDRDEAQEWADAYGIPELFDA